MTKTINHLSLLVLAALVFISQAAHAEAIPQKQNTVSMTAAGSGVNLGITSLLAKAFMAHHPNVEIKVPGSIGTKGAITAMKDNAITFGLISRPLKDNEQSPEIKALAYARTPIVIAVNPSVKDDNITSEELVAVYDGTKTKWADGNEIIVQSREAFDSGFSAIEKVVLGFKEACDESRKKERWATYFTDQDANQALANTPYAIGVTDVGMIATEKLGIKPLKLNQVEPNLENIRVGAYPLDRTLSLLYSPKNLPPEGQAFLDFIFSAEGKEILKSHGYLALDKPQ